MMLQRVRYARHLTFIHRHFLPLQFGLVGSAAGYCSMRKIFSSNGGKLSTIDHAIHLFCSVQPLLAQQLFKFLRLIFFFKGFILRFFEYVADAGLKIQI